MKYHILTLLFFYIWVINVLADLIQDAARLDEGREQLEQLRRKAQMPKYGGCWVKALEELDHGCDHLTDDEQSFLALT